MNKQYLYLENILLYSIILIPIFLITGPLVPEILMNISNLIFLFLVIKKRDFTYFFNKYSIFFLLFFIYINLNSLFSDNVLISLKSSFFYFRFYLMSLSIWYLFENKKNFHKFFFKLFLLVQVILVLDGIIQFFFNKNIFGWEKLHPDRVSSFFGDEMIMGSYLFKFLPITISLFFLNFLEKKKNKYIFFFFFLLIIIFTGIIISGERSAFFLSILFIPFLFFLMKFEFYKKKLIYLTLLLGSFLFLTVLSNETIKNRVVYSTINSVITFDKEKNIKDINVFSHDHETHIKTSINIFKDNFLIGVGLKQYRVKCANEKYYINRHSCVTHPHHTYAQFLSELGIIGTIFLLYFNIYVIFKLYKIKNFNSNYKYLLVNYFILVGIFLSIFPLVPSGNFFNNWLSIIFYIPIGFYLYSQKKLNNI